MRVTVANTQIKLSTQGQMSIADIFCAGFQTISENLGQNLNTRITYYEGLLEIISPC